MKYLSFLSLIFFLFKVSTYGQSTDFVPTIPITPPSPEASSLFKFVEVPVSLHNGMANIQIPIHNLMVGDLTIPISLNYHSRGIKVGEIASHVGIGWTLQFGGAISRQVRGLPDDTYFSPFPKIFNDPDYISVVTNRLAYNQPIDMLPDQFYFSFPGNNGKFLIAPGTGEPLIQDFQDINITIIKDSHEKLEGFIILDEKGNKYIFGSIADSESTRDYRYYVSMAKLPKNLDLRPKTTWHLTKIITSKNEEITFDYRLETVIYWRKSYDTGPPTPNTKNDDSSPFPQKARSYFSEVRSHQYQIKQINYPGGKVVFTESNEERLDLIGGKALDKIEVYNKNDSLIKSYQFSYEFVKSTDLDNQLSYLTGVDHSAKYRMFLKSIRKRKAGDFLPPYQFEYSSQKLPGRFSTSQDVWGFYNGADNGEFLTFSFDNDNRRVNPMKSGAGLLKKIIYPTGGSATFFYEQNKAVKPFFWDDLLTMPTNPSKTKSVYLGILDSMSNGVYSKKFTIGENRTSAVYSTIDISSYSDADPCDGDTAYDHGCPYLVTVTKINSNGDPISNPATLNTGKNIALTLDSGSYILTVIPDNNVPPPIYDPSKPDNPFYTFFVHLHWEEMIDDSITTGNSIVYGAGKRIKKIEYKTENGIAKTKIYEYKTPNGICSGRIFGLPAFYAPVRGLLIGGHQVYHKYGSKPGSPLISLQGNKVGYSHVVEYFKKNNSTSQESQTANGGKIEYVYTNYEDGGDYYEFPYTLPIDNEWLRGKLLLKKIYKNENNNYTLQKSVQNQYKYIDCIVFNRPNIHFSFPNNHGTSLNISRTQFILPLAQLEDSDGNPTNGITPSLKIYYQKGGTIDLHSTTITRFIENSGVSLGIEETTNYLYDYNSHYQRAGSEFIDSEGNKTIKEFFYPSDVISNSNLGYDNLTSEEMLAIQKLDNHLHQPATIVQIETTKKSPSGALLAKSAQRINYNFDKNENMVLPKTIQKSKGGATLENRIEFAKYDEHGNPLETFAAAGPHTVYLWGYNNQYLICKIENTSSIKVANAMNISVTQLEHLSELDLADLNALRHHPSLPNAMITTYTYAPLVGVTSITDPRGHTTYYEYDAFNRLKYVKDHNKHILKSYKYNYASE